MRARWTAVGRAPHVLALAAALAALLIFVPEVSARSEGASLEQASAAVHRHLDTTGSTSPLSGPPDLVAGPRGSKRASAVSTIFADGFEGAPAWRVDGYPTWAVTAYRASSGSWSAYCAGSAVYPPGPYYNNMEAWLVAGPFDLSAAATGSLEFKLYCKTEHNADWIDYLVSTDGDDFWGRGSTGDSQGWVSKTLDLAAVPTLGNVCGRTQIWIAFVFESDYLAVAEGAYVDDVRLTVDSGATPTPTPTPTPAIVVGTNPEYPPFEMLKNGKIIGFDIDLVTAIGERAGFTVEFRSYPFTDLVTPPGVWTTCGMVASALTPSQDRRQFMDFSDLYFDRAPYGPLAFAFPKGSAFRAVVDAALPRVKDDGTYAEIFSSWFVPKVGTLSPASAKRNATVTIAGSEFGAQRSTSYVRFGATRCTRYVSWSDTKIKCRVPSKARLGKQTVEVTTAVGTSNAESFTVKR